MSRKNNIGSAAMAVGALNFEQVMGSFNPHDDVQDALSSSEPSQNAEYANDSNETSEISF